MPELNSEFLYQAFRSGIRLGVMHLQADVTSQRNQGPFLGPKFSKTAKAEGCNN
jgi:hypothetical protein